MKRWMIWIACILGWMANMAIAHAEPERKQLHKPLNNSMNKSQHNAAPKAAVDLDAAAQATAALYASLQAPAAVAPAAVAPAAVVPAAEAPAAVAPAAVAPAAVAPAAAAAVAAVAGAPLKPLQPTLSEVPALPGVVQAIPQTPATQSPVTDVWAGAYRCELAEKVHLRPDTLADHVELQWRGQRWKMRRTDSRSGAMRLEDATARMVWIQLANKSMLLDQRQGRRLLDECQHDVQVQTAAQMKNNPMPSLFDTSGMGR